MKISNRGQVLVMFVLLIPIFLLIFVFVVDIANLILQINELNNINYLVIDEIIDKNIGVDDCKELILKNDNDIIINDIEISDNLVEISLGKKYNGFFSHLLNKEIYNIESNYKGYRSEDKKIIERVK